MEQRNNETVAGRTNSSTTANFECDTEFTRQRLDILKKINDETALEKALFKLQREKTELILMKNSVSSENAFAYFGLLLGIFPPAAIFTRFFIDTRMFRNDEYWILGVVFIVNLVSAMVGFFSGKLIGKIVSELEKISWNKMILALPFVGAFWGIMAGSAGGAIILIVGAFFGAFLGACVGGFALPFFTVFHRLLKRGDKIDRRHFLPLAFGVSFIVSAFFLGL